MASGNDQTARQRLLYLGRGISQIRINRRAHLLVQRLAHAEPDHPQDQEAHSAIPQRQFPADRDVPTDEAARPQHPAAGYPANAETAARRPGILNGWGDGPARAHTSFTRTLDVLLLLRHAAIFITYSPTSVVPVKMLIRLQRLLLLHEGQKTGTTARSPLTVGFDTDGLIAPTVARKANMSCLNCPLARVC